MCQRDRGRGGKTDRNRVRGEAHTEKQKRTETDRDRHLYVAVSRWYSPLFHLVRLRYLYPYWSVVARAAATAPAIPAIIAGIPCRLWTPHVSCIFSFAFIHGCNE